MLCIFFGKTLVVAVTTTLQIFSLSLFWILPTNHPQHHVFHCQAYRLQLFLSILSAYACQFLHSHHKLSSQTQTMCWPVCSPENCTILEGNQTSLQKLHKIASQPAELKNCTMLPVKLPLKNYVILPGQLLNPRIIQSSKTDICSSHKFRNPSWTTSSTQPRNCANPSPRLADC